MVEAECHRCGREWDYTGRSDRYGTCPNCKTSVKLNRGSERAEPKAERCPDPSDRTAEIVGDGGEAEEMGVVEAVEAVDESVAQLRQVGEVRGETMGDLAGDVEECEATVDDLERGLQELAGYFEQLIEEAGGTVEYDHIETEGAVIEALQNVEMEELPA